MLLLLSIVGCLLLALVGVLLLWSPGRPEPLLGETGQPLPGGLAEKVFVEINGVKQGMFIESRDLANPVLLYLHGGLPEYFLTRRYPTGLETLFTVVWWEQRGSGLSYRADTPPGTITSEQLVADTLAVTRYLRDRFGKEKIVLMGHSGGTFIGLQAAARAPALYYAYVGVAQMTDQRTSERLAYDYLLGQFRASGDAGMVRKLEAAPVTPTGGVPRAYLAVRDDAMHRLGVGTTREMRSALTGVLWPSLTSRAYTLREKVNLWRGKARAGVSPLWAEMIATDLSRKVPELELPVYFVHGSHDYTASYTAAKAYFGKLKAPRKGFYTFSRSAHSPMFEEPEKMLKILQEKVLPLTRGGPPKKQGTYRSASPVGHRDSLGG